MEHWLQKVEEANVTILVCIKEIHVINSLQINVLVSEVELTTVEQNFKCSQKMVSDKIRNNFSHLLSFN